MNAESNTRKGLQGKQCKKMVIKIDKRGLTRSRASRASSVSPIASSDGDCRMVSSDLRSKKPIAATRQVKLNGDEKTKKNVYLQTLTTAQQLDMISSCKSRSTY